MLKTLSRSLLLAGLLGSALALPAKAQVSGALVVQAVGAGSTTGGAATLPAVATKTTFLCGFIATESATAGATVAGSIVGLSGGNPNIYFGIGVTAMPIITPVTFSPCLPASGPNVTIIVNAAPPGVGGLNSIWAWGYQQ